MKLKTSEPEVVRETLTSCKRTLNLKSLSMRSLRKIHKELCHQLYSSNWNHKSCQTVRKIVDLQ